MQQPLAFALAALALLATPGPTNALLATSGMAAGFQRSAHLVFAAMLGYFVSVCVLALALGPLVRAAPALSIGLRLACALFLLYAAWKLWREGGVATADDRPISFARVFVVTALNPKAIILAFVIVPYLSVGAVALAAPYMAALMALVGLVASAWLAGGAALRRGAGNVFGASFAKRAGALVLCAFAALISASAFSPV